MSMKLKVLGLGLLAVMATSAFAVMNASATSGGHFTFGAHSVKITGSEAGENHGLHFLAHGGSPNERIGCDIAEYEGTHTNDPATPTTTTQMTITPSWSQCYTTGTPGTKFEVHENGCHLVFTVRKNPDVNDNTVHVACPAGEAIEITHPNCNITVPPQTVAGGVAYKPVIENGVHAITLESTATITTEYHEKICIFLGTHHFANMTGSVTVNGTNQATGLPTSITAT